MNGDFSRLDLKHLPATVLVQQGRPLSDYDWNASAMSLWDQIRKLNAFTRQGLELRGFKVAENTITLSPYLYVDGVCIELPKKKEGDTDRTWTLDLQTTIEGETKTSSMTLAGGPSLNASNNSLVIAEAIPVLTPLGGAHHRPSYALGVDYALRIGLLSFTSVEAIKDDWNKFKVRSLDIKVTGSALESGELGRLQIHSIDESKKEVAFKWSKSNASLFAWVEACSGFLKPTWPECRPSHPVPPAGYLEFLSTGPVLADDSAFRGLPWKLKTAKADKLPLDNEAGFAEVKDVKNTPVVIWDAASTATTELKYSQGGFCVELAAASPDNKIALAQGIIDAGLKPGDYWLVHNDGKGYKTQFHQRTIYRTWIAAVSNGKFAQRDGDAIKEFPATTDAQPGTETESTTEAAPETEEAPASPVSPPGGAMLLPSPSDIPLGQAGAHDLPLRHLAAEVTLPALRQWLASAFLSEIAGQSADQLRTKLERSVDVPASDRDHFERELATLVSLAQRWAPHLHTPSTINTAEQVA